MPYGESLDQTLDRYKNDILGAVGEHFSEAETFLLFMVTDKALQGDALAVAWLERHGFLQALSQLQQPPG